MQNECKRKTMELLAPAGGPEQLTAAVLCGADAVYFGAGNFNARRNAQNFELESLGETVSFCHLHGVAVHLTVNTLVFDRELPAAMETVRAACKAGVDALIVQDLGLARLIGLAAPDMPIHASTQMSLHNPSGVRLLEGFGYARAVLGREMSAEEIRQVSRQTSLELEAFVHGALCMCLSGQCYLSAVAGERSGNRGMCAQPCRLPFYEKSPQRCGLSLKDMSLFSKIEQLAQAGICSLKIEGRMKRPEYVAAAVTAGRAALAGEKPDLASLQSVFSRSGFTDGYFTGRLGPDMFGTRQKEDVTAASPALLKELSRLYAKETGRVGVCARMEIHGGEPLLLALSDCDGNRAESVGDAPEAARAKETTEEMVRQSLGKLGATPYHLEQAAISIDSGLAVPVSELNRLRREAVDALSAMRSRCLPVAYSLPALPNLPRSDASQTPALWVRLAYAGQLDRPLWQKAQRIILPLDQLAALPVTGWEEKLVAQLPPMLFDEEALTQQLTACREKGVRHVMTGNLGGILPAQELGMQVIGDFGLNVTNVQSLLRLKEMGLAAATLSIEMPMVDCTAMPPVLPRGIFAYGRLPLMTVRNCPAAAESSCRGCQGFRVMRDRRNAPFVVDCGGRRDGGHSYGAQIYNHLPLYLADRLRECRGLDFLTLYFTDESSAQAADIFAEYQQGGRREGITRGLYYRHVK
ncbi:MAG: U32 family peptidase [Oscillospiraceae bacterium]|nr:U32 family peptidase [Oscillospiraceae bacterium]